MLNFFFLLPTVLFQFKQNQYAKNLKSFNCYRSNGLENVTLE